MSDYTREEVQSIFSPGTTFTPQGGTWGLQGIVRVPDREGDWVYFVTFGQQQGDHAFDESITDEGVLSWQSQPSQRLDDKVIRSLIEHDERVNTIHLLLRTTRRAKYTYLGKLGYLTHDQNREATQEMPDELFRRAKATAAQRGQSLKQLVAIALERELARPAPGTKTSKREQAEVAAMMRELKKISKRISAVWPEGVSAVDAIREQRRDLLS